MRRQAGHVRENADKTLGAWLRGETGLPAILAIHGIVIMQDRKIVKTLSAARTIYSANRWSFSFEEQVTAADFQIPDHDPVTAAALRGFGEEFMLPADTCRVKVVSAIVEFPILNPGLVVLIETDEPSERFRQPEDGTISAEFEEIGLIDLSSDALEAEIERPNLHPASAIRLIILSRLLGLEAAAIRQG